MSFTKIKDSDFNNHGATSLPNRPTISADALKREFDYPAREIVAPAVNRLITELEDSDGAKSIGFNYAGMNADNVRDAIIEASMGDSSHISDYNNPHRVTAAQVGLGNVDNTSDEDKPVSIATRAALDTKVDIEDGKGLSTNDFSDSYKSNVELNTTARHTHDNKDVLDAFSDDGTLKYKGQSIGGGGGGGLTSAYTSIKVGNVTMTADNADTFTLKAGNNVSLSANSATKEITINSQGGGSGGGTAAATYFDNTTTAFDPDVDNVQAAIEAAKTLVDEKIEKPTSASNGQVLTYNGSTNTWAAWTNYARNQQFDNTVTDFSPAPATTQKAIEATKALVDGKMPNPTGELKTGHTVRWDGTGWKSAYQQGSETVFNNNTAKFNPAVDNVQSAIEATKALADAKISNPSTKSAGQALVYDGSVWKAGDVAVINDTKAETTSTWSSSVINRQINSVNQNYWENAVTIEERGETDITFAVIPSLYAYSLYADTPDGSMVTVKSSSYEADESGLTGGTMTYTVNVTAVPTSFALKYCRK